ncbi:MAG: hypothetical protein [Wendovervirus sonii]|uniref:Tail fiber protein n=1 Tax=phage Lak_Megaphage_Sonny TaxID=3109229 RepID=A0ABZ0Z6P8_9CAUD|nr:MAG: hypothetical protein [phage Lak_Megaphage_Sonny]
MADYVSLIKNTYTNTPGYIHDTSSMHQIVKNADNKTYTVKFGYPNSEYTSSIVLQMPSDVLFYADADAIIYKTIINGGASSPGTSIPASNKGWLYKVGTAGYIAKVKCDAGDVIVCNTTTTTPSSDESTSAHFDFFQANIDSSLYSLKGHTHSVSKASTSDKKNNNLTGSVTTKVIGATTTFTGKNTPSGTIDASFTYGWSHKHTFTGSNATLTFSYDKIPAKSNQSTPTVTGTINSHSNYVPSGTITPSVSYVSTAMTLSLDASQGTHNHTFNGTAKTDLNFTYYTSPANTSNATPAIEGTLTSHTYKPQGTIAKPTVNVTATYTNNGTNKFTRAITVNSIPTTTKKCIDDAITDVSYIAATEELKFVNSSIKYNDAEKIVLDTSYRTGILIGITNMTATVPVFTGTAASITHDITNLKIASHNHKSDPVSKTKAANSYTPEGTINNVSANINVSQVAIKYSKVSDITMAFTGDTSTMEHSKDLTLKSHTHTITTVQSSSNVSYTPAGSTANTTTTFNASTKTGNMTFSFTGTEDTYSFSGIPLFTASSSITLANTGDHTHTGTLSVTIGSSNV